MRLALALVLCGVVVLAACALLLRQPGAAGVALGCALAGAGAAWLWRDARTHDATEVSSAAALSGRGDAKEIARVVATSLSAALPADELLEAMLHSMREGLLVLDADMRVLLANRAAGDIFGANPAVALQARRLTELTRNPAVLHAFSAALLRGERVEAKFETTQGDRRAFDLRVAPFEPNGASGSSVRGAIGVFFDITRLERLERVRQEFLSNVSHELRTPLTAIRTFVETLDAGALEDHAHNRRFLAIIDRNAARMHTLIDDILELSAIEAGTVEVAPAPVQLRALVQDVLTALAARAAEREVELQNEIEAGVVVQADARRLEQMLTNLTDNAIKFNRPGGRVAVAHTLADARDRISITDTGEGIAPEHIKRIFERFYRVDRARSRALGGTGLGLAIVKHLARAHGGEANVQSTPGTGSTFTIELPHE
ncbi:MAG TPA: ATP-binding protein [Pyrinomonadaceae bacterium]|jgi:two-component system phosphate regulon sensor histidine kinase PhoR